MNNAAIRAFFDTRVDEWDSLRYGDETYIGRGRAALRFIHSAGTNRRVLDLGCGTGRQSLELLRQGQQVVSADFSPEMARATRERILREYPESRPLVVVADATQLPFRDGSFDSVLALGLVGFVANRDTLLGGLHDVLTPHGELACDAGVPEREVLLQAISRTLEAPFNGLRRIWCAIRRRPMSERSTGWYSQNFIKHSPAAFETLLQRNGFTPIDRAGAGFGELRIFTLSLLPWRLHSLLTRILNELSTRPRTKFLARHALTYVVRSVSITSATTQSAQAAGRRARRHASALRR